LKPRFADSLPTYPVLVRWDAGKDKYVLKPLMSKRGKPDLHADPTWQDWYREPVTIYNAHRKHERFQSYHAEAVSVRPGKPSVLLGLFYANAPGGRCCPTRFEINIWRLARGSSFSALCVVGNDYPPRPLFIKPVNSFSYEEVMSRAWAKIRTNVHCY
jgi:hypothetical protein